MNRLTLQIRQTMIELEKDDINFSKYKELSEKLVELLCEKINIYEDELDDNNLIDEDEDGLDEDDEKTEICICCQCQNENLTPSTVSGSSEVLNYDFNDDNSEDEEDFDDENSDEEEKKEFDDENSEEEEEDDFDDEEGVIDIINNITTTYKKIKIKEYYEKLKELEYVYVLRIKNILLEKYYITRDDYYKLNAIEMIEKEN